MPFSHNFSKPSLVVTTMLQSSTIPTLDDALVLSKENGWNNSFIKESRFSLGSVVKLSEGHVLNEGYDSGRAVKETKCFVWILLCNGHPQKKAKKHVHLVVTPEKPAESLCNLMKPDAIHEDDIVEDSTDDPFANSEQDTSNAFKANLSEEVAFDACQPALRDTAAGNTKVSPRGEYTSSHVSEVQRETQERSSRITLPHVINISASLSKESSTPNPRSMPKWGVMVSCDKQSAGIVCLYVFYSLLYQFVNRHQPITASAVIVTIVAVKVLVIATKVVVAVLDLIITGVVALVMTEVVMIEALHPPLNVPDLLWPNVPFQLNPLLSKPMPVLIPLSVPLSNLRNLNPIRSGEQLLLIQPPSLQHWTLKKRLQWNSEKRLQWNSKKRKKLDLISILMRKKRSKQMQHLLRRRPFLPLSWRKKSRKKQKHLMQMMLTMIIMPLPTAMSMSRRKEIKKKNGRKITGAESPRLSILVRHSLEMLLLPPVECPVETRM